MAADLIVPDTKDWTWTTERRCDDCGFDASRVAAADLPGLLQDLTEPWGEVLAGDGVAVRAEPTRWSPLEYACHVHEVLEVFAGRFDLILEQDAPTLPNWDQDAAATQHGYAAADASRIAGEIPERAAALVAVLDRYGAPSGEGVDRPEDSAEQPRTPSPWGRSAVRSDGAPFTALSLARYLTHDLAHHLHDVGLGDRIPSPGPSGA